MLPLGSKMYFGSDLQRLSRWFSVLLLSNAELCVFTCTTECRQRWPKRLCLDQASCETLSCSGGRSFHRQDALDNVFPPIECNLCAARELQRNLIALFHVPSSKRKGMIGFLRWAPSQGDPSTFDQPQQYASSLGLSETTGSRHKAPVGTWPGQASTSSTALSSTWHTWGRCSRCTWCTCSAPCGRSLAVEEAWEPWTTSLPPGEGPMWVWRRYLGGGICPPGEKQGLY